LGLGSVAMGNWIKSHKEVFLAFAIFLMALSLTSAVRDKIKKGNNTGLIIFSIASVVTLSLLFYNKIMYGYFI
jgi:hypothetical protein